MKGSGEDVALEPSLELNELAGVRDEGAEAPRKCSVPPFVVGRGDGAPFVRDEAGGELRTSVPPRDAAPGSGAEYAATPLAECSEPRADEATFADEPPSEAPFVMLRADPPAPCDENAAALAECSGPRADEPPSEVPFVLLRDGDLPRKCSVPPFAVLRA